jgi:hypothetical protein
MDRRVDDGVEHHPVRNPAAVAAPGMTGMKRWTLPTGQGVELLPQRLGQA